MRYLTLALTPLRMLMNQPIRHLDMRRSFYLGFFIVFTALAALRALSDPMVEPLERLPKGQVTVRGNHPDRRFNVWLAATDARREQGLMFIKSLPPDQGMLFVFEQATILTFWMKNTYIPLDLLYIGPDNKVVNIIENATPLSLAPLPSQGLASQVLELGGGTSRQLGLMRGDRVEFRPATR